MSSDTDTVTPDAAIETTDEHRSLRERVADSGWRQRIAARRALNHPYRLLVGTVGGLVVAIGVASIPLPGPGWLIVFAGLFILATEFAWAERLLAYTRHQVDRWTEWMKQRPLWLRGALGLLVSALCYGLLVLCLHVTGVPEWVPGWVPLWR